MPRPARERTAPALTDLAEDERLLQASVLEFARTAIAPLVRQMDEEAAIPRRLVDQLAGLGLMGIEIPERFGGAGGSFFQAVLAVEALSRVDPAVAVLVDVQNTLIINALLRWGHEEQQARWLPRLAAGDVGAYALSEAEAGSDAFALRTRARAVPGGLVLDGRKLWITNASEAALFIVFATIDPDLGHRGVTAFLLDRSTPGLRLGRKEDKLGIRASSTCELILEECRVTDECVLGPIGQGYKVAIETLNEGRIGIGAQMVGLAQGALDHAVSHAKTRHQFGRPIADFQGVQFQLARAATEVEAARLLVYNAARRREAGHPFASQAAMAKLAASETAERTASLAVNLFGAAGFVTDSPVEKLYRDAKIGQIYEGTSNLQLQTIARYLLE